MKVEANFQMFSNCTLNIREYIYFLFLFALALANEKLQLFFIYI